MSDQYNTSPNRSNKRFFFPFPAITSSKKHGNEIKIKFSPPLKFPMHKQASVDFHLYTSIWFSSS
jgi:hypothetical protein